MEPVNISTVIHRAAALATGCKIKLEKTSITYDLRQNKALSECPKAVQGMQDLSNHSCSGDECADVFSKKFGPVDYEYGIKSASTDFVSNVTNDI